MRKQTTLPQLDFFCARMHCWSGDQSVGSDRKDYLQSLVTWGREQTRHQTLCAFFYKHLNHKRNVPSSAHCRNECRWLMFVISSDYRPSIACDRFLPCYFFVLHSEQNRYLNKRDLIINYFHCSMQVHIGTRKWLWWLGQVLDYPEICVRWPAGGTVIYLSTASRDRYSG